MQLKIETVFEGFFRVVGYSFIADLSNIARVSVNVVGDDLLAAIGQHDRVGALGVGTITRFMSVKMSVLITYVPAEIILGFLVFVGREPIVFIRVVETGETSRVLDWSSFAVDRPQKFIAVVLITVKSASQERTNSG